MNLIANIEEQLHDYLLNQGLISHNTKWFPQTGVRRNKVWRLMGNQDLICKLYLNSLSNPLFADTPTAEYQLFFTTQRDRCCAWCIQILRDSTWPSFTILLYRRAYLGKGAETVANLLCRVHELKSPPKLRILLGLSNDIKNYGLDI